jgi:hypothetical protein
LDDRKYSDPPLAGEALPGGDVLGQSVKPGLPASSPAVSIWVTVVGPPPAREVFEKAYTWAAWKMLSGKNAYSLVVM